MARRITPYHKCLPHARAPFRVSQPSSRVLHRKSVSGGLPVAGQLCARRGSVHRVLSCTRPSRAQTLSCLCVCQVAQRQQEGFARHFDEGEDTAKYQVNEEGEQPPPAGAAQQSQAEQQQQQQGGAGAGQGSQGSSIWFQSG